MSYGYRRKAEKTDNEQSYSEKEKKKERRKTEEKKDTG